MRFLHSASDRRNDSEVEWQRCHFCIFSQPLFVFMKALTLRHVPNCHFECSRSAANRKASYWAGYRPTSADLEVLCRISTEPRNLLPLCSPLYWPHIIERNAGSFLWKELGGALSIGPRNFLNFFLPGGKKIEPQTILIIEG